MNPTTDPPVAQPPRSSFSCDAHPQEQFTGFCPSCLCERLHTLDQNDVALPSSSTSRRPSFSSIKSILKLTTNNNYNNNDTSKNVKPAKPSSGFFPELRRSKSFSASKNEKFSGVFEPQRHSCDVRGRNTLWTLFSLDDEAKVVEAKEGHSLISGEMKGSFPEENEGRVEENEGIEEEDDGIEEITEIRAIREPVICENVIEEGFSNEGLVKIKDHLDLENDSQVKKGSSGMNFWSAASGFSKKWQKWVKQKRVKKSNRSGGGSGLATLPVEKPISRQFRETQSEIADYGFGRRSCDTDPRFSLDAGRMSFDDGRYSFDEPRASWDGYLLGRSFSRLPPMVEDVAVVHVPRIDANIPVVEEDTSRSSGGNGVDENVPGGSVQTRDYYLDSSCKRRKSLDRSSSIRKTAASVVAEIEDMKVVSNAKVSPATIDYVCGGKVVNGDRDLRDSNSNSLRDDCSETFELGASVIENNGEAKGSKKSRRWSWNIWGFIQRRGGGNKYEDEERYNGRGNGVERSFSESWRENNRGGRGSFNRKVFRSNSSVSWRNSNGSMRKSTVESNVNGKKKKEEVVLERNRSARYSPPNHIDNGLLRFYLTPLRNSRRGKFGKSRSNNSHSMARSVLRLY
ncbi:hypothetical protein DCAR_0415303 [Daucus carota subsp. sativus]|uniref:Uncharacterized protein n=1 Tax=Daucus carota subsp. sativus TaxID=79200 RepID=A0A165AA62_DAUCS|nr:PREDICTED: UPF0503 protein At3g09070, chloroplastic-like [Daucus carota subsp. sativus]WOG95973.1 hypothetical protein DCAR_0415303 [Daucus carota subsp. sativus]